MIRNIMVAIDEGPESARALDTAIELAAGLGAALEIVHACPPPPPTVEDAGVYLASAGDLLAKAADRARASQVVPITHLKQDTVVFALLEAAEERQPQLLVVGSHGRHGVSRALLGSVSDSLARRAKVPVLIVPSPARQPQAARAAWSCAACGHILDDAEPRFACSRCGATPADWITAAIVPGPVDIAEPAVGEAVGSDLSETQTRQTLGLFSTSPPGTEGYDVNPELRVRY